MLDKETLLKLKDTRFTIAYDVVDSIDNERIIRDLSKHGITVTSGELEEILSGLETKVQELIFFTVTTKICDLIEKADKEREQLNNMFPRFNVEGATGGIISCDTPNITESVKGNDEQNKE